MLMVILQSFKEFVLYEALLNVAPLYNSGDLDMFWFDKLEVRGKKIVRYWGSDQVHTSESVLACFVQADEALLSTVPDCLWDCLAFAAGFWIGSRIVAVYYAGVDVEGPSDVLIATIVKILSGLPYERHHPAKRCAKLLKMFISWSKNINREKYRRMREEHLQMQAQARAQQEAQSPASLPMYDQNILDFEPWPSYGGAPAMWNMNMDGFAAMSNYSDFWSSFPTH
jgi:hypothetical protein